MTTLAPVIVDSAPNTVETANRARYRIARRLLPYRFILYVIAFLDLMNIGAAALQMPPDLAFSERVIGTGAGIFFIGYSLLEIPGALIVERWSARKWSARITIYWGLMTVLMAFIHTARQFYAVRFLVGAAEAGFLLIWAVPTLFVSESAAAASIGLINAVGNRGGLVGPMAIGYLASRTHSFCAGLLYLVASLFASGAFMLSIGRGQETRGVAT